VMEVWGAYIEMETLSSLIAEPPGEGVFTASYKLGGYEVLLGVKKLG